MHHLNFENDLKEDTYAKSKIIPKQRKTSEEKFLIMKEFRSKISQDQNQQPESQNKKQTIESKTSNLGSQLSTGKKNDLIINTDEDTEKYVHDNESKNSMNSINTINSMNNSSKKLLSTQASNTYQLSQMKKQTKEHSEVITAEKVQNTDRQNDQIKGKIYLPMRRPEMIQKISEQQYQDDLLDLEQYSYGDIPSSIPLIISKLESKKSNKSNKQQSKKDTEQFEGFKPKISRQQNPGLVLSIKIPENMDWQNQQTADHKGIQSARTGRQGKYKTNHSDLFASQRIIEERPAQEENISQFSYANCTFDSQELKDYNQPEFQAPLIYIPAYILKVNVGNPSFRDSI